MFAIKTTLSKYFTTLEEYLLNDSLKSELTLKIYLRIKTV